MGYFTSRERAVWRNTAVYSREGTGEFASNKQCQSAPPEAETWSKTTAVCASAFWWGQMLLSSFFMKLFVSFVFQGLKKKKKRKGSSNHAS